MDIAEADGIAIRALGSLFKLTEVFLWDDLNKINFEPSQSKSYHEVSISDMDNRDECSTSFPGDDEFSVTEDLELAQMGALGLPISFNTTKEKRNGKHKGKTKKGGRKIEERHNPPTNVGKFQSRTNSISDIPTADSCQCSSDINEELHQMEVTFDTDDNCQSNSSISQNVERPICAVNDAAVVERVNGIKIAHQCLGIAQIIEHPLNLKASAKLEVSSEDSSHECSSYLHDGLIKDENSQTESCLRDSVNEFVDSRTSGCCYSEHTESVESSLLVDHGNEIISDGSQGEVGSHSWMVIWDTVYEANYFYNILTGESTWYPPPGFEEYQSNSLRDDAQISDVMRAISDTGTQDELSEGTDAYRDQVNGSFMIRGKRTDSLTKTGEPLNEIMPGLSEANRDSVSDDISHITCENQCPCNAEHVGALDLYRMNNFSDGQTTHNMASHTPECKYDNRYTTGFNEVGLESGEREMLPMEMIHTEHDQNSCQGVPSFKKKKKTTRIRYRQLITCDESNVLLETNPEVAKYWCQRYLLFSRFDCGIKMDVEGWYSVTPEKIAEHQASRCGDGIFIDCFTGVGGNAIQFAMKSKHVVAIDIDPVKIDYAHHNAMIYGVQDHIDFILGDFFHLTLKGDVVFLSPPWGGPDYGKVQSYDIQTMLQPHNADLLFKTASRISPCVVMFLPRNVNLNQLAELALMTNPPWKLEVEKNFLNGKLKAITAYFHDTSRSPS